MHDIAVGIAENLYFDMAGGLDIFLNQNVLIAKAAGRFALTAREGCIEISVGFHLAHALTAAAGHGLNQNRIANHARLGLEEFR